MRIRFMGQDIVANNLRTLARQAERAIDSSVYEFAEEEMAESKKRVPVDTGNLRATGHVDRPRRTGNRVEVAMGYGGQAITYAMIVHEDLEAFHRIGQAKYLESVMNESRPFAAARIGLKIKRKLGT